MSDEQPTEKEIKEFKPEINNPCWGCEYRKSGERFYINICLLDINKTCVREVLNDK